ncbi:MAG: glycerophosphoryl diester phosphodiesterase [Alphaproteobacteria bacterium]|nr:glycerophosphoryl diester phosphodiesterase [Alphaproteobacteria bacterium]
MPGLAPAAAHRAGRLGCPPLPAVIGHRGAAAYGPENTLASFRQAAALGCGWVEFDVRLTADGALVVFHDSRLDRTTDGCGRISALPLAAIRRCDAGSRFGREFGGQRVPTLSEALHLLSELQIGANIELKADRGLEHATGVAAAAELGARPPGEGPPILLSSFLPRALAAARDRAPALPRGILFKAVPRRWREIAARLGCATIHAEHRRLRRALAGEIRQAGFPLLAYTVNDPARARTLFGWGVTSVFSDAPDIILARLPAGSRARSTKLCSAGAIRP